MTRRIGVAMVAAALVFGGSVAIASAAGCRCRATLQKPQTGEATDVGARRPSPARRRHVYRPISRPSYYDRPPLTTPAAFFPFLGFATGHRGGPLKAACAAVMTN